MLRRIPPWHFVGDPQTGRSRPSSAAFEDDEDGHPMSIYRRNVIENEGGSVDRVMGGHDGFGLVSLTLSSYATVSKQTILTRSPARQPTRLLVVPKRMGIGKFFARPALWVIQPPD